MPKETNEFTEGPKTLSWFLWINLGNKFSINGVECSIAKKEVRTTSGYVTLFSCYEYTFIFENQKPFEFVSSTQLEVKDVFGQVYTLTAEESN